MARVRQNGMLGSVQGKVGNVVRTRWKDKEVLRAKGVRRSKKLSETQLNNRSKFGLGSTFVCDMGNLFDITYRQLAIGKTARNAALSNLMQNAITGSSPNYAIDYARVNFSVGNGLNNVADAEASSVLPGMVRFSWTDLSRNDKTKFSDKAMLVAYSTSMERGTYNTAAADRDDLVANLKMAHFRGETVHTWIIFISEDQSRISETKYTGLVEIK